MNNNVIGPKGWICPKCSWVWGPHVSHCGNCNKKSATTDWRTGTNPLKDKTKTTSP